MIQKLEGRGCKSYSPIEIWDACGNMDVSSGLVEAKGDENPAGVVKGSCHDLAKQLIRSSSVCIQTELPSKAKLQGTKRSILLNNMKVTGNSRTTG